MDHWTSSTGENDEGAHTLGEGAELSQGPGSVPR